MRPSRIVVGEVRQEECLDLLIALNSGIPGLATIHANTARDALLKLCTLPLLAGRNIDAQFIVPTVAASIDLIVHCSTDHTGRRFVREILAPTGGHTAGIVEASVLYRTDPSRPGELDPTGMTPAKTEKFTSAGMDLHHLLAAA